MFLQMELMFCMFCQPDRIAYYDSGQTQPQVPHIPPKFISLEFARDAFYHICLRRYALSSAGAAWSASSPAFQEVILLVRQWHWAVDAYVTSDCERNDVERKRAFYLKQQASLLVGALLYSVRTDIPVNCYCRPILADLSVSSKLSIFVRVHDGRKVNLTGINTGVPADLKASGLWLWPNAKRLKVEGGDDYVLLEILR